MNKTWIIIGIVTLLLIGGVYTFKKMHHWHHGMHNGKMLTWMAEKASKKLDLNDEQKERLDALVNKYQPLFQEIHDKHRKAGETLIAEFKKENFSREAFELNKAQKPDMHDLVFDFLTEFHAILTPEQRQKASDHIAKHMERHKKWRE